MAFTKEQKIDLIRDANFTAVNMDCSPARVIDAGDFVKVQWTGPYDNHMYVTWEDAEIVLNSTRNFRYVTGTAAKLGVKEK